MSLTSAGGFACADVRVIKFRSDRNPSFCRLDQDRPHALDGFAARLAAKITLHNACYWHNRLLDRPLPAFADLLGW